MGETMNQPTTPDPAPAGELPPISSTIYGLLALRAQRLNNSAFSLSKLPTRITREVELYLTLYKINKEREAQQRQAEIDQLPPAEWLQATLAQARAAIDQANLVAQNSEDPATVAAALARAEAVTLYIERLTQRLEEVSAGEVTGE
jgi:hypothetical protein